MTIDEFLEELSKVTLEWRVNETFLGSALRAGKGDGTHCPISAVTGALSDFLNPIYAGQEKLGLSFHDAAAIVRASDVSCDQALRRRLLQVCGLQDSGIAR